MRRVLRLVAGWFCVLLGTAGLVLPILQGWLLIGLGALLLAPEVPFFARFLDWIENRFPSVRSRLRQLRTRFGLRRQPRVTRPGTGA
jgi:uncharacterized protein